MQTPGASPAQRLVADSVTCRGYTSANAGYICKVLSGEGQNRSMVTRANVPRQTGISGTGVERVGRHSEHSKSTARGCVGRAQGSRVGPLRPRSIVPRGRPRSAAPRGPRASPAPVTAAARRALSTAKGITESMYPVTAVTGKGSAHLRRPGARRDGAEDRRPPVPQRAWRRRPPCRPRGWTGPFRPGVHTRVSESLGKLHADCTKERKRARRVLVHVRPPTPAIVRAPGANPGCPA